MGEEERPGDETEGGEKKLGHADLAASSKAICSDGKWGREEEENKELKSISANKGTALRKQAKWTGKLSHWEEWRSEGEQADCKKKESAGKKKNQKSKKGRGELGATAVKLEQMEFCVAKREK